MSQTYVSSTGKYHGRREEALANSTFTSVATGTVVATGAISAASASITGAVGAGSANITGTVTAGGFRLSDTSWEDLRFPAQGINPPGAATDPARSTSNALLYFEGNVDETIAGVAQVPHAWKRGTALRPHIHLVFPTSASANTRWRIEWDVASPNGDFNMTIPTSQSTATTYTNSETITVANPADVNKHVVASFASWTMTGITESACILWRITRLANSDAADNHNANVVLLEFDIHYEIDKFGTDDEFPT